MISADVAVIGGGVAGAGVSYFLAEGRRVVLLEAEAHCGYHTSGRSAALFSEIYGGAPAQALTRASRAFYEVPPEGFTRPLLKPRGVLYPATDATRGELDAKLADPGFAAVTRRVTGDEARAMVPILRPEAAVEALFEPDACDIDTDALLQGFIRSAKARGAQVVTDARVSSLQRKDGLWRLATAAAEVEAPVVVNAAGAWADEIARLAGLAPVGLQPYRRTAMTVAAPLDTGLATWPMVVAADDHFYFRPEAGRLLICRAEETPSAPCDAAPEELDVAIAVNDFEAATGLKVERVLSKWAGLRTFAPDRAPVVGYDPAAEGFFWLAGQGGFGMQTAPALSQVAAHLVMGEALPPGFVLHGVELSAISVKRFRSLR
ncbi:MAG: FAD-binding oxidoreductase [Pseudomonadota bacterium]|jgi:D-arginine dehydrogenase